FWQDLRLLGIKTTPADHFVFLDEVVSETLSAPARVLIAGSADYSILAQLLAIDRHGAARITVTDHCETPLFLCRWYAERQGAAIETTVSDAVAFAADEPFDLICAHSFLSYFAPQRRPALMARWYDLLRPGGRVVT